MKKGTGRILQIPFQPHHGPQANPERLGLLPWKVDAHSKHSDASFLQLLDRQCHVPLGPPISDKDEDLGHRGICAPRKPFAQKVFQSKACLCAPSSELTQQEKKQRRKSQQPWEVKLEWEPETMGSSITSDAALSQQRL